MNQYDSKIPKLYETEPTPVEDKIIHQHYLYPPRDGFYWLIAELDLKEQLGFGYACLNDPEMAEWGYVSIKELEDVSACSWDDSSSIGHEGKNQSIIGCQNRD